MLQGNAAESNGGVAAADSIRRAPLQTTRPMGHRQCRDPGRREPQATARTVGHGARKFEEVGDCSAVVGKADVYGNHTLEHMPKGRGFDESLVMFIHGSYHWNYGARVGGSRGPSLGWRCSERMGAIPWRAMVLSWTPAGYPIWRRTRIRTTSGECTQRRFIFAVTKGGRT